MNEFSYAPDAIGAALAMPRNAVPFSSLPANPLTPGLDAAHAHVCLGGDAAPGPGTNPQLSPLIHSAKRGGCGCGC